MVNIQEIPLDTINWSSPNIRSVQSDIPSLAASIEAHGQLEPGCGWWSKQKFFIATGHRRADACRLLKIPFLARIIASINGADLIALQLVENIQSENLLPEDLERALGTLLEIHESSQKVAMRLGMSVQWVNRIQEAGKVRRKLLHPEDDSQTLNASEMMTAHSMSTSTAAKFGRLDDDENRRQAFAEAVQRNKNRETLSAGLIKKVVDDYSENEIRDVDAYVWKLKKERVKLVRRRADIEAEIDRIDAKIARLSEK